MPSKPCVWVGSASELQELKVLDRRPNPIDLRIVNVSQYEPTDDTDTIPPFER